jgi:hypothetical protein
MQVDKVYLSIGKITRAHMHNSSSISAWSVGILCLLHYKRSTTDDKQQKNREKQHSAIPQRHPLYTGLEHRYFPVAPLGERYYICNYVVGFDDLSTNNGLFLLNFLYSNCTR